MKHYVLYLRIVPLALFALITIIRKKSFHLTSELTAIRSYSKAGGPISNFCQEINLVLFYFRFVKSLEI